jgi:glycosyltransferase involved in cell wall biosynthesis
VTFHIVIPSLNQGRFIGTAIRSVLDQRVDVPVTLAIVDACSTDQTMDEIHAAIEGVDGSSVRLVREPDGGQADAINKGIALGSAEVVGWLNADDRLLPGALARAAAAFAPGVAFVYGDTRYIDENGAALFDLHEQDFRRTDLLWGPCYVAQPSTFVAGSAWRAVGGLRTDLHYAMDLDLWLRLSRVGRVVHLAELLSEFRVHATSKTVASAVAARREAREVRRAHVASDRGRPPTLAELEVRRFIVRCRRSACRTFGVKRSAA